MLASGPGDALGRAQPIFDAIGFKTVRLEWADGVAFGTPNRFGNVSAQLKLFLDLAGEAFGALAEAATET